MKKNESIKKKILIIDDNAGILFALKEALVMSGYDVQEAASYPGQKEIGKYSLDLIFLDVFLASQDGRTITRELKANPLTKHIPIVLLSAYPNIEELSREAGADGCLAKPFQLDELIAIAKKFTA